MLLKEPIKRDHLLLTFVIAFILVDICPYPNWPPGVIQTSFQQIQQIIVPQSKVNNH